MKIAILFAALCLSTQAHAVEANPSREAASIRQVSSNPSFLFLRGHKQGTGQALQWSVNTSAGIDRFEVQYTYEDPTDPYSNWYTMALVNPNKSNVNKYTDNGSLPGIINYRIVAVMTANSGVVVSEVYTCTIGQ